jgi:hypothetical protein
VDQVTRSRDEFMGVLARGCQPTEKTAILKRTFNQ